MVPYFTKEMYIQMTMSEVEENTKPINKIEVYLKDFYNVDAVEFILKNVVHKLEHENDGIIFTFNQYPYTPGTCYEIIKWKPPSLNTVDFKLRYIQNIDKHLVFCLYCFNQEGRDVAYDLMFFETDELQDYIFNILKDLKKKEQAFIVECRYDDEYQHELITKYKELKRIFKDQQQIDSKEYMQLIKATSGDPTLKGGWRICRVRTDKEKPNFIKTAERIQQSISDSITEEDLIAALCKTQTKRTFEEASLDRNEPTAKRNKSDI